MCGITGYVGDGDIVTILIEGLKRLEYRGYDSAGICVANNNNLSIVKRKGKIAELEKELEMRLIKGKVGIAHTRWATHGEPNEVNAHPHFDCNQNIALVHNGIVENYGELKLMLEKEGHKIISKCDSEILAHLIEKYYKGNLETAVREALKHVEGTYGLAIVHKNENKIVVAKKVSPLIIGVGKGEMFVASDVTAILKHTKNVVYLQDGDVGVITKEGYELMDLDGKPIERNSQEVNWSLDQIEKKGHKYFMIKEIMEQPESIANAIRGRIQNKKVELDFSLDANAINRIIIIACGTSWHAGLVGKYLIEKIARIPVEVDYAPEFRYRNPVVSEGDVVIAVSQSGETADTIAGIHEAKKRKAKTIGIVNVVGSTVARDVDSVIYIQAGPEIGVASTKAFTGQITTLTLLALQIAQLKGLKVDEKIFDELLTLPNKVKQTLEATGVREIAEKFVNAHDFLYLGRGINFPVALEGALKMKEISYIHAEGYPAAEMKHGPIALIDENMPVLFIATKDELLPKVLSNMQEVKARRGKIIAVVNEVDENIRRLADYTIVVPQTIEELSPIINVIPLQLLSYYVTDIKGIDPDKPRNLAKSVTVE